MKSNAASNLIASSKLATRKMAKKQFVVVSEIGCFVILVSIVGCVTFETLITILIIKKNNININSDPLKGQTRFRIFK